MQERIDLIRHKLKFSDSKPRVVLIESLSPLTVAGNGVPELIEIAGGVPLLTANGKPSQVIDWAQIREADPDILVISPIEFTLEQTLGQINSLTELPGWLELKAVKSSKVYLADGKGQFNSKIPLCVDTLEILAEILNPKQFVFGHEGTGWLRF